MQKTMKAWVYERYGAPEEVLELRQVDVPTPESHQVLIRVHAASVNPLDWHLMTGTPRFARLSFGLFKPKRNIPGADVAGTVESVGEGVTRFQPGDVVFGETVGSLAEYVVVSEEGLVTKPANTSFEEAAAVPIAGLTAVQGLRDWGKIQPGHEVLIIGASGGVGTFAVQVAKSLGAVVTAVCSTRNVDTARAIGADRVVDYTKQDFIETGDTYDLIFDGPGNRPLLELKEILSPEGIYVLIGGRKGGWIQPIPRLIWMHVLSLATGFRVANGTAKRVRSDLMVLRELLDMGKVKPVIDRNYKMGEVPQALTYQGTFHARGKIVITV